MVKLNNQLPIVRPVIEGGNGRINYNHGKKNKIRDNPMGMGSPQQLFMNPRLFLLVACLWPLVVLALFTASAPGQKDSRAVVSDPSALSQQESSIANNKNGFNLRNVLDRVDIMGYGPTHPRVAFVVVGEDRNALIQSIESIFSNTDMKRIFIICAVLDGHAEDPKLVKKLHKIENGSVPHWHGLKSHVHLKGSDIQKLGNGDGDDDDDEEENSHSPKIHVLFNPKRKGLTASRSYATEFIQILVNTHESAGFKSPDEDVILLLLQGGSKFNDHKWLQEVTPALIVPPPLLGLRNKEVAMKIANAISFHVEGAGKRTSFDKHFAPIITDATTSDINQSSGRNFPTPALNGAAIAMRLDTYLNLPMLDLSLMDNWLANLDLALNLWLCADGIDVIDDVEVTPPSKEIYSTTPMSHEQVARFASVYMDDLFRQRFFQAAYSTDTRLDWETDVARIRQSGTAQTVFKKCRTFEWYIKEVNTDLSGILEEELKEDHRFDPHSVQPEHVSSLERKEKSMEEIHIEPPEVKEEIEKEDNREPPIIKEEIDKENTKVLKKKPLRPLRPENLEIAQNPQMIDISFVDVSDGHQEHPHLGALDANGVSGYIHNETVLRMKPPAFYLDEKEMKMGCSKVDDNYRMMSERIVVETDYDKTMDDSGQKRDKIFCFVYTIESGHPKIPNIRETWGSKCDGFMVASNKTDIAIGAVNIPHEGPEEYNNIWQKVRSMWSYIYDNYYERYDWFHIG